jgi:hypothetical protein
MMLFMPKGLIGLWDLVVERFAMPRDAASADRAAAK